MYLSELKLWNFRKYGVGGDVDTFENSSSGLTIMFHKGVNVLIGENDSGKTAIIDAIRYVLHTKSGEYISIDEKDFHKPQDGSRSSGLKIECVFRELSIQEEGKFIEYLSVEGDEGQMKHILRLTLKAKRLDSGRISQKTYVGDGGESNTLPSELRDSLSAVYLKPLRDASQDMSHGYRSRLAQILQAHPIIASDKNDEGNNPLEENYKELKSSVDEYFSIEGKMGKEIVESLNKILRNNFLLADDEREAKICLVGSELSEILRQLDLILEENKSGLGSLNMLCMAAELLLFNEKNTDLNLALIEELEAHIHPQLQLRILDYLDQDAGGQFILTTHSITLGATIPLEKLIIMKGNKAFSMDESSTMCTKSDYEFLHRFLDATKANLFFARGLIIVEGDAENLLIPTIAEILGRNLHKYGVSIVNVGSTAYKRYVKIFQRKDEQSLGLPISIISDLDVRSIEWYEDQKNDEDTSIPTQSELESKREEKRTALLQLYSGEIQIFLTKCWTLEYEIARSRLFQELALAIRLAKEEMNDKCLWDKREDLLNEIKVDYPTVSDNVAYEIFKPLCIGSVSKAITAQYLAKLLNEDKENVRNIIENDEHLKYIVDAIKHVTGG